MGRESENQTSSRDLLASKNTLREILEVAIQFEKTAFDFYTDLIPKVSKQIRYLVEELAEEEQQHFDLFSNLLANPEIESQLSDMITTPPSNGRFSEAVQAKDLGESPDDQSILQYALSLEQAAMEQYTSLSEEAGAGPIKDLFTYLAHEETEHKNELEKIYYQVVHSGGV
ncbi:MAG: ferritin family protein [Gammaproteobacteria bacterium]|nr:ferritin family protein [Gammaproteobacteria bacterium]